MRDKLSTLQLTELRKLGKELGIKGVTTIRKSELIDLLLKEYEKNEAATSSDIKQSLETEQLLETNESNDTVDKKEKNTTGPAYKNQKAE